MKAAVLTLLLFLLSLSCVTAQRLVMRQVYGEYVFTRNDQILKIGEVINALPPESETVRLLKRGRRQAGWARFTGIVAVSAIGTVVSDLLLDDVEGDVPWWLGAGGLAFLGVAIPLQRASKRNVVQATEVYNTTLEDTGQTGFRPVPYLGVTGNGVGVAVRF